MSAEVLDLDTKLSREQKAKRLLLITDNKQVVADSYTDLVEFLNAGYTSLGEEAAIDARIEIAVDGADQAQMVFNEAWSAVIDFDALDEARLTALRASRGGFIDWAWIAEELGGKWDVDIPLVVVSTDFQPITAIPLLDGEQVHVVDPTDERALIITLSQLGLFDLVDKDI